MNGSRQAQHTQYDANTCSQGHDFVDSRAPPSTSRIPGPYPFPQFSVFDHFQLPPKCENDLTALVESSNYLLNMERKLTKVQTPVPGVPPATFVRMHLDDRFSAEQTRIRKSATPPGTFDRTATESYPLPVPRVIDFTPGMNSRWWQRGTHSDVRAT
jgi:hypothetical protein